MRVQGPTYERPTAQSKFPWDQPVGGSFMFPNKETLRDTQKQAASKAAGRRQFGEQWTARQIYVNGAPAVRIERVR